MSVNSHFGSRARELRVKEGDVRVSSGEVLSGKISLEEAQARMARRVYGKGTKYKNVGQYDPVLRAHCRLDGEG